MKNIFPIKMTDCDNDTRHVSSSSGKSNKNNDRLL